MKRAFSIQTDFPGLVSVQTSHWWMFRWTGVGVSLGCHDDDLYCALVTALTHTILLLPFKFYPDSAIPSMSLRWLYELSPNWRSTADPPWKPLHTFMSGPYLYLLRTFSVRDIYYHIVECRFPHLVRFSIKFIDDCIKKSSFFNFRSRRLTDWAMSYVLLHKPCCVLRIELVGHCDTGAWGMELNGNGCMV